MDAVFAGDEELTRELMAEIAESGGTRRAASAALPRRFPASRIDAAFRLMAQGKHIGKVVVAFSEAFVPRRGEAPRARLRGQTGWRLPDHRGFRRIWQSAGRMAGGLRRAASGAGEPKRRLHGGSTRPLCASSMARGVEMRDRQGGCGLARGRDATHRGDRSRRPSAEGLVPSRDGHRRCADGRPHQRAACATVMAPKAHGAWLLHEATREYGSGLLRHVLVGLQHLWQSGAGKLRGGQCIPGFAGASPPRARSAGPGDQLGRARRRRLRGAQ